MNKIEKFRQLSYYLRHFTEANIYPGGWVKVNEVLSALNCGFEALKDVVMTDDKGRYSFDATEGFIRANYGHSVKVDMRYAPVDSRDLLEYEEVYRLYHFTKRENVQSILKEGIKPGKRLYVHLTDDLHSNEEDVPIVVNSCHLCLEDSLYNPVEHIYLTKYVRPYEIVRGDALEIYGYERYYD